MPPSTNNASELYSIDAFRKIVDSALETLVTRISVDYELNIDELKAKYLTFQPHEAEVKTKKKGRKKKTTDNVIETVEYTFENIKYLVDKHNNVYTYNIDSPTQVGKKLADGSIKFHKRYKPPQDEEALVEEEQ
jgi:hypothetical protein